MHRNCPHPLDRSAMSIDNNEWRKLEEKQTIKFLGVVDGINLINSLQLRNSGGLLT